MPIVNLTQTNFDQVVRDHNIVVIDFWASKCAPCRAFEKVITDLDKQYPDVTFATVDVEKETQLAEEFNILSIPAIMVLRDRVVVVAETGALTTSAMAELLDQVKKVDQTVLKQIQEKSPLE